MYFLKNSTPQQKAIPDRSRVLLELKPYLYKYHRKINRYPNNKKNSVVTKWTPDSVFSENAWLTMAVTNSICDNRTLNGAILQKNSFDTMGMKTAVVSNVEIITMLIAHYITRPIFFSDYCQ